MADCQLGRIKEGTGCSGLKLSNEGIWFPFWSAPDNTEISLFSFPTSSPTVIRVAPADQAWRGGISFVLFRTAVIPSRTVTKSFGSRV